MNRKSRLIALFILGVGLGLVVWSLSSTKTVSAQEPTPLPVANQPTGDNGYCLVCHSQDGRTATRPDGTVIEITVNQSILGESVHGQHAETAVGCVECHGEQAFPHLAPLTPTQAEQGCRDCHADQAQAIADKTHGGDLLGNVDLADVTCLTCHGSHEIHPVAEMACQDCHSEEAQAIDTNPALLDVSLTTCQDCHAQTISEWRQSGHGGLEIACASCHLPHQDKLRFETVEGLCLNCHDQDRTDYTHTKHVSQSCADCHVYQPMDLNLHVKTDAQAQPTGHENSVSVQACIACHSSGIETVSADDAARLSPIKAAEEEIIGLETHIEEQRTEGGQASTLRFIQTALIGLALGSIGSFMGLRYRRRIQEEGNNNDD